MDSHRFPKIFYILRQEVRSRHSLSLTASQSSFRHIPFRTHIGEDLSLFCWRATPVAALGYPPENQVRRASEPARRGRPVPGGRARRWPFLEVPQYSMLDGAGAMVRLDIEQGAS
jgi:hypothetical protein